MAGRTGVAKTAKIAGFFAGIVCAGAGHIGSRSHGILSADRAPRTEIIKRDKLARAACVYCYCTDTVFAIYRGLHEGHFPAIVQVQDNTNGDSSVTKTATKKSSGRKKTTFGEDKRRKHHHFLVTVSYADGERFGRVYTDKEKADRFADRQRRSPVVKSARVTLIS